MLVPLAGNLWEIENFVPPGFGNSGPPVSPDNVAIKDDWTEFGYVDRFLLVTGDVQTSGIITLTNNASEQVNLIPLRFTFTSPAFAGAQGQTTVLTDDFATAGVAVTASLSSNTLSIDVPAYTFQLVTLLRFIIQLNFPECTEGVCCNNSEFAPNTTSCRNATACSEEAFCTGHSEDCPAVQFAPKTQSCRLASACSMEAFCTGASAECPPSTRPDGAYCPWYPARPRPHGYRAAAVQAANMSADMPDEAIQLLDIAVPASADQAAAWLTGLPSYDVNWPECVGKCIKGYCALEWDHPACCFVDRQEMSGYTSATTPKDTPDSDDMAAISRSGYWKSRNFYC